MILSTSTTTNSRRIVAGGRRASCAALVAIAWISFAAPTAIASTPSPDTAPPETAPSDATPPETTPSDTASPDTTTLDTSPGSTTATGAPTGIDATAAREENPSAWWWIGGAVVGAVAFIGIVYGVRRRRTVEDWAGEASLMCDIGRAMTATLDEHLRTDPVWSPPDRYERQRQRFDEALGDLVGTVPDDDFAALLDALRHASTRLDDAVAALVPLQPNETARAVLQPALDDVASALSAVENEASITVFGTALPSSRPSA